MKNHLFLFCVFQQNSHPFSHKNGISWRESEVHYFQDSVGCTKLLFITSSQPALLPTDGSPLLLPSKVLLPFPHNQDSQVTKTFLPASLLLRVFLLDEWVVFFHPPVNLGLWSFLEGEGGGLFKVRRGGRRKRGRLSFSSSSSFALRWVELWRNYVFRFPSFFALFYGVT